MRVIEHFNIIPDHLTSSIPTYQSINQSINQSGTGKVLGLFYRKCTNKKVKRILESEFQFDKIT